MIKYGVITRDNEFDTYIVYEKSPTFIRLDVYNKLEDFNAINTMLAIGSYILDKKEKYYGDKDLVKEYLNLFTKIDSMPIKERKVETKEGKIEITVHKEDNVNSYDYISQNRRPKYECYVCEDYTIEFGRFQTDNSLKGVELINDNWYTVNKLKQTVIDNMYEDIHSLEYLKAENPDISLIEQRDYVVVQSMEQFEERLKQFVEYPSEFKGIDTETSGLHVTSEGNDYLTGVILSPCEGISTYFPFRQKRMAFNLPIEKLEDIFNAVRDLPKEQKVLAHFSTMEIKSIYKEMLSILIKKKPVVRLRDCIIRIDIDTYITSVLVNPTFAGVSHSLKDEAAITDKIRYIELSDIFKNRKAIDFAGVPEDIARVYACPDGDNPIKIYKRLIKELPQDEKSLANLEYYNMRVKAINEYYGMKSDYDKLVDMFNKVEKECALLEDMFKKAHNISGNIRSPLVLRDIIYGKLNAPVLVMTEKTGLPAVNKTAIAAILNSGVIKDEDVEIPESIKNEDGEVLIEGKDLRNKYKSLVILQTYNLKYKEFTQLRRLIENCNNGVIEFNINPVGAESGRQTSNAHQFSDPMKETIVADTSLHDLWDCDFKQVELRILMTLAHDEELIESANDPDTDLHRAFATKILGIPMWSVSAKQRGDLKPINFGVVYGKTEYGLARDEYGPGYTKEQLNICRDKISNFFLSLPLINRMLNTWIQQIRDTGYVKTEWGRYRYNRFITSSECPESMKKKIVRQLKNTPIQGYGADVLKMVEKKMWDYIIDKGWDEIIYADGRYIPKVRMIIPVHDEILFSASKDICPEEILIMCKECFELPIKGAAKLYAAPSYATNWLEAHNGGDNGLEIPIRLRDIIIKDYKETGISKLTTSNWKSVIADYSDTTLKSYMDSLINKWVDEKSIAEHVRHPNLTHTLIAQYAGKAAKKLTQLEAIDLAVHNYLQNIKDKDEETTKSNLDLYTYEIDTIELNDNMEEVQSSDSVEFIDESAEDVQATVVKPVLIYYQDAAVLPLENFKCDRSKIIELITPELNKKKDYKLLIEDKGDMEMVGFVSYNQLEPLLKGELK